MFKFLIIRALNGHFIEIIGPTYGDEHHNDKWLYNYAFEMEGLVPPFKLDRGDAAMIAYGASQFALTNER